MRPQYLDALEEVCDELRRQAAFLKSANVDAPCARHQTLISDMSNQLRLVAVMAESIHDSMSRETGHVSAGALSRQPGGAAVLAAQVERP